MINKISENIETICLMGEKEQNKTLKRLAKLDYKMKLEVLAIKKSIFYKLKQNHDIDVVLLDYCSLILAIAQYFASVDNVKLNASKLKAVNENQTTKLLSYWSLVKQLKHQEGLSFDKIVEYLAKNNKFEVSKGTLYKVWKKVEQKNENI